MASGSLSEMKLNNRILLIFLCGFLLGIVLIYAGQDSLVAGSSFLDQASVERIGSLEVDRTGLFFYSIRERLLPAGLLALLSMTGIGGAVVCCYLVWCGFCAGTVLSVLSLRYGIRGVLLFAGAILPQALLLVPAYLMLFRWCVLLQAAPRTASALPVKGRFAAISGVGSLLWSFALLAAGCLAESYLNPVVLKRVFLLF